LHIAATLSGNTALNYEDPVRRQTFTFLENRYA
jgi:hypothetical protein